MTDSKRRSFFKKAIALSAIPLVANETNKAQTLKFIHITDSHMDLSDSDSVEAMELMSHFINKNYKDLDFVLFGGDNFNNNVKGDGDARKFKEIIATLHCPAYVVRGNKEANPKPKDSVNLKEFQKMFFTNKDLLVHGKDWKFEKKGYQILGLDSCIEGANNGIYTKETLSFAKKALQSAKPTIILNHHPYTNYWGSKDAKDIHKYVLNNAKETQKQLLSNKNVILTLSGHKHIDSVKNLNGTKMIVTRGFVRPLDLDAYPMRYIEINSNNITEKLIYTTES